ncbi:uncharacterized protein LOC116251060 isoform X1 [Nymphaea colorata]|nr:uncharacterized protein LOC116251060 isoform X1 [Nymphaea colorata]
MHILHRGGREIGAIYIYRRHPHGKHGDNDKLALFPRLRSENNCVSPWQHNFWLGHQLMAFHKNRRQKRIWFDMYREKNVQVATSQNVTSGIRATRWLHAPKPSTAKHLMILSNGWSPPWPTFAKKLTFVFRNLGNAWSNALSKLIKGPPTYRTRWLPVLRWARTLIITGS